MKAQHTPGPWVVDGPAIVAQGNDHLCIGGVWPFGIDAETAEANARLIAAAPELLEKLQQLLSAYEQADHRVGYCCCGEDMAHHSDPMNCGHISVDAGEYAADNVISDVKALIAKATGGEV